jgi:hypothetical protein
VDLAEYTFLETDLEVVVELGAAKQQVVVAGKAD